MGLASWSQVQLLTKPVVGKARDPLTGRFAPKGSAWSVAPAFVPGGRLAWKAGGVFYAKHEAAVKHAVSRRPGFLAPKAPVVSRPDMSRGYVALATQPVAVDFGAGL